MAGLVVANNIKRLVAGIKEATAAWKTLEARGLVLDTEEVTGLSKAAGHIRPILHGISGGVACTVRIVSDKVQYAHTRVSAKVRHETSGVVGVHPSPAGILGTIRSWLGQDIEIGDVVFDEAFLITGKPEQAPQRLLSQTIRERIMLLASVSLAGFTYGDGEVVVLLHGVETDSELLSIALDLVQEAANVVV